MSVFGTVNPRILQRFSKRAGAQPRSQEFLGNVLQSQGGPSIGQPGYRGTVSYAPGFGPGAERKQAMADQFRRRQEAQAGRVNRYYVPYGGARRIPVGWNPSVQRDTSQQGYGGYQQEPLRPVGSFGFGVPWQQPQQPQQSIRRHPSNDEVLDFSNIGARPQQGVFDPRTMQRR